MTEDESQEILKTMLLAAYDQGRVDAVEVIEKSLIKVLGMGILEGDKQVGFSHAILLVSDTYDLMGLERPD